MVFNDNIYKKTMSDYIFVMWDCFLFVFEYNNLNFKVKCLSFNFNFYLFDK
jgi:hypothetical protein